MFFSKDSKIVLISVKLFCLFYSISLSSQNILIDGSFEETYDFEYNLPFDAFNYLKYWKNSSWQFFDSTITLSPDLMILGKEVKQTMPPTFWNISTGPSEGDNYVGLVNKATKDGAFLPETISTRLKSNLELGEYYTLSLDYRNKGKDYIIPSPMECIDESLKKLIFYFDDKPIFVELNEIDNISTPSSDYSIDLHTDSMKPYKPTPWEKVGTCFQARGFEKYLALSMTTGRVKAHPPCTIEEDHYDIFLHYYFDVDNIRLEKMPSHYRINASMCEKRPIRISIKDSLILPTMLSPITFSYNNDQTDDLIYISKGGTYTAYVNFDCTSIPVYIDVTELDCTPKLKKPNVFYPNGPENNSSWQITVNSEVPLEDFFLTVTDRWGNTVFRTSDPEESWTGLIGDTMAPADSYLWILRYSYRDPDYGIITEIEKGDVLLIR